MTNERDSKSPPAENIAEQLKILETQLKTEIKVTRRMADLEAKVSYDEGRRAGVKFVVEIVAVVLTILVGAGIATLWVNLQNFEKSTVKNIESQLLTRTGDLEIDALTREAKAVSAAATREADIEAMVNSSIEIMLTRADEQLALQQAYIEETGDQRILEFATRADQRVIDVATRAEERLSQLSNRADEISIEVSTRVYKAVDAGVDGDQLQLVAVEVLQTRIGSVVEETFEESVQQAVEATTEVIVQTATAAVAPTTTPTPRP